jgi:hypothetical protein
VTEPAGAELIAARAKADGFLGSYDAPIASETMSRGAERWARKAAESGRWSDLTRLAGVLLLRSALMDDDAAEDAYRVEAIALLQSVVDGGCDEAREFLALAEGVIG